MKTSKIEEAVQEVSTFKFNVNDAEVKSLNGMKMVGFSLAKILGDILYQSTTTLEWVDKAIKIHNDAVLELTKDELEEIKAIIYSPNCMIINPIKQGICNYIDSLLK